MTKEDNIRKIKYSLLYSILISAFITLGGGISKYLSVFKASIFLFIILLPIIFILSYNFLNYLPLITKKLEHACIFKKLNSFFFKPEKKCYFHCFLFILLCYIPVIFTFFPGIVANDVLFHANFFINHDYIEIHPILYNFIVYLILALGVKIKSITFTIYLYVLIQTLIMISIFTYCIYLLIKYNTNQLIKLFSLLFFAIYPINHVFCASVVKDTLFSGFCMLFILSLIEIANNKQNSKLNISLAVISGILMLLFRHNGLFAYLIILPFLYIFFKNRKKIFILLTIPLFFYLFFSFAKNITGIEKPPIASYLAIPLQQMGYVRIFENNNITEEEKNIFRNIVSEHNELGYNPFSVDSLKFDGYKNESLMLHSDFMEESLKKHPELFIKLYFNWGVKYKKDYINALALHTYYYWAPTAKWSRSGVGSNIYAYTGNNWTNIFNIPVKRYNFLPKVYNLYYRLFHNNVYENSIITQLIFSIGANTNIIISGFFILFYKRRYDLTYPLLIIPALFITVLFGPVSFLRYVYQNFIIIPLLLGMCFSDFKKNT